MNNIPLPKKHASCQMLLGDTALVHHGSLRRKRTVDSIRDKLPIFNWGSSYVVIHGGCIYMYNNELSRTPEEAASLFGFTKCHACPKEVPQKILWPFKMTNALAKKELNFYFSASSESTMNEWILILNRQMSIANASMFSSLSPVSSVMEIRAADCYDNTEYNGFERLGSDKSGVYDNTPCFEKLDSNKKINEPDQLWKDFYWNGRPSDGDKFMKNTKLAGTFMVRKSTTEDDTMTLLVRAKDSVFKFKLNFQNDKVCLDTEEIQFDSVPQLVCFYTNFNISNCGISLGKPYAKLP